MEWNWCWNGNGNGNDMTPFMLYESSGDSEEVKLNDHHGQYSCHEATMNEHEDGVYFRYDDVEDVIIEDEDDDDDAQSCSYDHSSYINTSFGNSHHDDDQSSQRLYDIYTNSRFGNSHHDDDQSSQRLYDVSDVDDHDDDDYKNWGESKLMDPSKQQKRSHKFCGDSLDQREIDKQFWESCLAS